MFRTPRPPWPGGRSSPGERPDLALLAIWAAFAIAGLATAVWALARSLVA